jgi:4-hydroxybenzoate polyprenyltransferase
MKRFVPPRLRAPVAMLVGGAAIAVIAAIHGSYGWKALLGLGLFTVVFAVGWYLSGGRDNDFGALMRDKADERQAYRRLKTQALVGIVTSVAVGVIYLAALAAKATIWPLGILVFVPGVTFIVGWVIYREPGGGQDDSPGDRITG